MYNYIFIQSKIEIPYVVLVLFFLGWSCYTDLFKISSKPEPFPRRHYDHISGSDLKLSILDYPGTATFQDIVNEIAFFVHEFLCMALLCFLIQYSGIPAVGFGGIDPHPDPILLNYFRILGLEYHKPEYHKPGFCRISRA
jgi:hypothetical protein